MNPDRREKTLWEKYCTEYGLGRCTTVLLLALICLGILLKLKKRDVSFLEVPSKKVKGKRFI
jgi:hypothetical protein